MHGYEEMLSTRISNDSMVYFITRAMLGYFRGRAYDCYHHVIKHNIPNCMKEVTWLSYA